MLNHKDLKRMKELKAENLELNYLFTTLEEDYKTTISTISHELRNTLTLVISSLQYIESCHNETREFKYWIETMSDLSYMKELLISLSEYNNGQNIKLEKTDIRSLIGHIYHSYLPMIEGNSKTFNFTSCTDSPLVLADKIKFQQALINLIKNAFEAISANGTVTLDLKSSGDFVAISITDDGCGMDEEQLKHIFTLFTTFKQNGTGLGLSITKSIIEGHNGILKVDSTSGKGSVFMIILPKYSPKL